MPGSTHVVGAVNTWAHLPMSCNPLACAVQLWSSAPAETHTRKVCCSDRGHAPQTLVDIVLFPTVYFRPQYCRGPAVLLPGVTRRGSLVMSGDTHEASSSVSESPASWHYELPVCSTSASGQPLQFTSSCTEPVHIFVKRRQGKQQQLHHGGHQYRHGKLWRHLLPIQDASPAGRGAYSFQKLVMQMSSLWLLVLAESGNVPQTLHLLHGFCYCCRSRAVVTVSKPGKAFPHNGLSSISCSLHIAP
jgi:hypothetical protein